MFNLQGPSFYSLAKFAKGKYGSYFMKVKSIIFFIALLTIGGCERGNKKDLDFFNNKIHQELKGSEQAIILASELTRFSWEKLCFERKESLELSFHMKDSKVIFKLNYEDYFVNEAYVKGSLDEKCVRSHDRLLIKKMYANRSKPIEFFKEHREK